MNAYLALNDDKTVNIDSLLPVDYADEFAKYFAGNESAAFKVGVVLSFNKTTGMFELYSESGENVYGTFDFDQNDKDAFNLSAFMNASGLGLSSVTGKVDFVAQFVSGVAMTDYDYDKQEGNGVSALLMGYSDSMIKALGFEEGAASEEGVAKLLKMTEEKMALLEAAKDPGYLELNSLGSEEDVENAKIAYAQHQLLTNYAVLEAASTLKSKDTATAVNLLKNTKNFSDLVKTEDGIGDAAMAYGLYTAYAYSLDPGAERDAAIKRTEDPMSLLKSFDDPGFQNYLDGDTVETDLKGYVAAMNMINDGTNNAAAVENLMLNGFNDPALAVALQQALNK